MYFITKPVSRGDFNFLDLEDHRAGGIRAASNDGISTLCPETEVAIRTERDDHLVDIIPGPGAEALRQAAPGVDYEFLAFVEYLAVTQGLPAFGLHILVDQLFIKSAFQHGNFTFDQWSFTFLFPCL